jgi:phosphoglycerol transferase MdoB-like AlkP superfamily enzyme
LWNPTTETKKITKVASQIDVLPTLLNLFGINYDSRMIVGKDILSNSEGLAIFSNRSWVTDKGKYYARTSTFVPNEGVTISNDYVANMNINVANKFSISSLLLENNYYKAILNE